MTMIMMLCLPLIFNNILDNHRQINLHRLHSKVW